MKYITEKKGRYYFTPSIDMRKMGFKGRALGPDPEAAAATVAEYIEAFAARKTSSDIPDPSKGSFSWLISTFQNDPTWYGQKARATREEMDYAFKIIAAKFGGGSVRDFERRHARLYYNELRHGGASIHKANKVFKWLRRLMRYAQEIGVQDINPIAEMSLQSAPSRGQVWQPEQVDAVIAAALAGGKSSQGNLIPPRPSIALAIMIAYDTSLPQQDILALTWDQFDGEGLTVIQQKKRGNKPIWVPLSQRTLEAMDPKNGSTHVIVSEETKQPYLDTDGRRTRRINFSRLFARFRDRTGVPANLKFQDLRRTVLSELGNSGATTAEIVSFSGHKMNSKVLDVYVKPDKRAAKAAGEKRKSRNSSEKSE